MADSKYPNDYQTEAMMPAIYADLVDAMTEAALRDGDLLDHRALADDMNMREVRRWLVLIRSLAGLYAPAVAPDPAFAAALKAELIGPAPAARRLRAPRFARGGQTLGVAAALAIVTGFLFVLVKRFGQVSIPAPQPTEAVTQRA